MTNKADYTALINTNLPDGANIPSSDHRATMHTDADSIGEAVFGDGVSDDESTETYTTANANFDYDVTFRKVGSQVTMSIRLTANSALSGSSFIIMTITDSDLLQEVGSNYYTSAIKLNTSDTLPLLLNDNKLITSASLLSGEGFRATITYNTEN